MSATHSHAAFYFIKSASTGVIYRGIKELADDIGTSPTTVGNALMRADNCKNITLFGRCYALVSEREYLEYIDGLDKCKSPDRFVLMAEGGSISDVPGGVYKLLGIARGSKHPVKLMDTRGCIFYATKESCTPLRRKSELQA